MLMDEAFQALFQYMRIDFRGRNVGMPQQLLDRTQIGAAVKQVTGEGVAQDVRADTFGINSCFLAQLLEILRKSLSREVPFGTC